MQKSIYSLLSIIICSNSTIAQSNVVIKNINIITMNSDVVLANKTVFINDSKIVSIENNSSQKIKKNAIVIDGTNKFLMPALYDMHLHWPTEKVDTIFKLQLLAGIATSRIMNSKPDAINFKNKNELQRIFVAFNIRASDSLVVAKIPALIDSVKKAGYDFIKIFSIQNSEVFDAVMKAAKQNNMIVCGHALQNIDLLKLIESGYRSIEHLGAYDKIKSKFKMDSLINASAKNHTFICPTLDWEAMAYRCLPKDSFALRNGFTIGYKLFKNNWDTEYVNKQKQFGTNVKRYADFATLDIANKIDILKYMKAKNIPIIAGSDAEEAFQTPGYSLIEELFLIQKAGLNNYQLLQTVTTNAAQFFKEENITGTIEKGKQANLIILTKNPLTDIKNLESVETIITKNKIIKSADILKSFQLN